MVEGCSEALEEVTVMEESSSLEGMKSCGLLVSCEDSVLVSFFSSLSLGDCSTAQALETKASPNGKNSSKGKQNISIQLPFVGVCSILAHYIYIYMYNPSTLKSILTQT